MAEWLTLLYRLPTEPSSLRVAIWRRLKAAGAVYLKNSVAVLPRTPEAEQTMQQLRADILREGGTAVVLSSTPLGAEAEQEIVALFQQARDAEYAEVIERCRDFLEEVDKETRAGKFTFAELEDIESDLIKLRQWLGAIAARPHTTTERGDEAKKSLAECEEAFSRFAGHVYGAVGGE